MGERCSPYYISAAFLPVARRDIDSMLEVARASLDWIAGLVAPVRCAGCEAHGEPLCSACTRSFAENSPVTRSAEDGVPHVIALGPYAGSLARAIRTVKFGGRRAAAHRLGGLLAATIAIPADVVVAVPLHRARLRERGFNQATLLASAVATRLSIPLIADAIRRVVQTRAQSTLALDTRLANMLGAFAPGAEAARLENRRVLLVDDVVTTGATLAACADVLRRSRARSVDGAAIALTLR